MTVHNYFVGTSGFSYRHWRGVFYPPDLHVEKWLEFYASNFGCVEINSSFYRLPDRKLLMKWEKYTPEDFRFVFKGIRTVTHIKRLRNIEEDIEQFYRSFDLIVNKISAVLWQFSPAIRRDITILEDFLDVLPIDISNVIEFRDSSWFTDSVFNLIERKGASMCVHDMKEVNCPRVKVGRLLYIRFHGTEGKYKGSYSEDELKDWAKWIKEQDNEKVLCFFNNDIGGHAIKNAMALLRLLETV